MGRDSNKTGQPDQTPEKPAVSQYVTLLEIFLRIEKYKAASAGRKDLPYTTRVYPKGAPGREHPPVVGSWLLVLVSSQWQHKQIS